MDQNTTDNATILGEEVGKRFAEIVRRDLADDLEEIVRRNLTDEYENCCATHDFCDANMLMDEAFKDIMGRELRVDDDVDLFISSWAWAKARGSDFKIQEDDTVKSLTDDVLRNLHLFKSDDGQLFLIVHAQSEKEAWTLLVNHLNNPEVNDEEWTLRDARNEYVIESVEVVR
ncbi:MAG: hypothetical protein V3S43_03525 [Acidimicrobiia bacterium]